MWSWWFGKITTELAEHCRWGCRFIWKSPVSSLFESYLTKISLSAATCRPGSTGLLDTSFLATAPPGGGNSLPAVHHPTGTRVQRQSQRWGCSKFTFGTVVSSERPLEGSFVAITPEALENFRVKISRLATSEFWKHPSGLFYINQQTNTQAEKMLHRWPAHLYHDKESSQ